MKFYKFTNKNETHNGKKYHTGLNVDILPFNPKGDCEPGGIYFAREDILGFISYPGWIREVRLPKGEPVYENPGEPKKWKACRVIFGPRKPVNAKTIQGLIKVGANIHAADDFALYSASTLGFLAIVRTLLRAGADVHAREDEALIGASYNGHLKIVRVLLKAGANVHGKNDEALTGASRNGHLEVVRVLLKAGANVHGKNDRALRLASLSGHLAVVRVLLKAGANVHAKNDEALQLASLNGHLAVVRELKRAGMSAADRS